MDGWLCVILAHQRGMIDTHVKQRIFACMSNIGMCMYLHLILESMLMYTVFLARRGGSDV